ncbi:MAG TPA: hypothetical protein VF862_13045 [Gemmatimonadales bacterium]
MTVAIPARSTGPASMIHPVVDILCVGGLSILVLVPMLLSGRTDLVVIGAGAQAWVATMINMPHFMASYRIVYRTRESILAHKWASMGIPALLTLWIAVAVSLASQNTAMVVVLVAVASGYLAWHYTGQVWGMMVSFALLEGTSFTREERLLVRGSLRFLLVWHLTWFVHTQMVAVQVDDLYKTMTLGTLAAFAVGVTGLAKMRQRIGRLPPVRSLVAWVALFVWYAAMARDPKAIFWVQIAHALQYLEFPVRVEMNYATRRRVANLAGYMAVFGAALIGVSILMSQVVPRATMMVLAEWLGEEPGRVAPVLILSFINIHHYFTDQVAWKLRNPEVRRDLFAHVPALAGDPPAAVSAVAGKARRRR